MKNSNTTAQKINHVPETLTSLAAKYNVSLYTFRKWIAPIEDKIKPKRKKTFSPAELKIIFKHLGEYDFEK